MPKLNVYVPDALAERIRITGVSVSPICQRALEQEVRRVEAWQRANDVALRIAERFAAIQEDPDPDDVVRESEGYAAGTHWARDVASSQELAELGGVGIHGGTNVPVNRGQPVLYQILTEAGLSSDSETNRVLSTTDPWGRGFLRACQDLWRQVQPLM